MALLTEKNDVTSSLSKLDLEASKKPKKATSSKAKKPVADSWEDEDLSDSDPDPVVEAPVVSAPPPTPSSPSRSAGLSYSSLSDPRPTSPPDPGSSKRPEKTDAVARRMIAAGLGLKAPKQTDEQKEYQKSIREQEKKKREREKEEQQRQVEATERAKAAVWDD